MIATISSSWTGTRGVADLADLPNEWDEALREVTERCALVGHSIYEDPRVFTRAIKRGIEEFGEECLRGVLIANDFSPKLKDKFNEIAKIKYSLENFDSEPKSFEDLIKLLKLTILN